MKDCAHCGRPFEPFLTTGRVCSTVCALRWVRGEKLRERAQVRQRREALKPRAKWLAECQAIVNKYVRLRDKDLPCCSCDRPASWDGQWHASHFRSVGAATGLRFHLWNIHKGCSICNNHLSGNLAGYWPRILAKLGQEKLDWLEAQNAVTRYPEEYLKRFKLVMGKKLRRKERASQ